MNTLEKIKSAQTKQLILDSTAENLKTWLDAKLPVWTKAAIEELVASEAWSELNDRFFQNLKFATAGMRGRTIGKISAKSETGESKSGCPEYAAVGSNTLNDFNIIRATIGLFRYTQKYLKEIESFEIPRFVIAHDVRYFSRHFCELSASTWTKLGGQALIFDGPRSTPQLSFSIREFKATVGAVITASHNPPHDNGFKAYFSDGAQVISPHAEGIIDEVNKVALDELMPFLGKDIRSVIILPSSADRAYLEALEENVLNPEVLEEIKPKVVYTPIHGTGGVATLPILRAYGVNVIEVPEQAEFNPAFPTVKSPNPENQDALALGIEKAKASKAVAVIGNDPDSDRMGVAILDKNGDYKLITGNMIATAIAEYRIRTLKDMEIIPKKGTKKATLIKSFVTTPILEAIARKHGIKLINTLTGFKWIGSKLLQYEAEMKAAMMEEEGIAVDYDKTEVGARIQLLLDYSTYFVFGGEESYGFLASDRLRDKDASAAALMMCELIAHLQKENRTVLDFLDEIYGIYGYYLEDLINVYYEGASGASKIRNIVGSFRSNPPKKIGDVTVTKITDFSKDELEDADGDEIPKEDFFRFELKNGFSFDVRASGTEPKIKFYLYGNGKVPSGDKLDTVKATVKDELAKLASAIKAEADTRAGN